MLTGMMAYTVGCHETETQEISLVAMKQKNIYIHAQGKVYRQKDSWPPKFGFILLWV